MRFFLILILLLSFSAHAERQRMALVIGNQAYQVAALNNPVNDARDIAAVLRKTGFQVTLKLNATQSQMETAMNEFGERLNANTDALFYYSGHGVQHNGENYLIPIGSVKTITAAGHLRYKAVPAGYMLSVMKNAKSPLNVVVLDACRNNPFKSFSRTLTQGLARMPSAEGSLIAYATAPGNVAFDDGNGRNSPYTQHLLTYMQKPGLKLEDVLKRTRSAVKKTTRNQQTPWYESSIDGDFYFVSEKDKTPLPPLHTARLTVRSNQYNDQAWIDGKAYGTTPIELTLPLGRHQVKVTKAGFADYEHWLELQRDTKLVAQLQRVESIDTSNDKADVEAVLNTSNAGKKITVAGKTYIIYDNGTVLDTQTDLLWMRCAVGQTWTGSTCTGKAKEFNWETAKEQTANFAGYSDWRIPSIKELRSLVYCSNGKPTYFNQGQSGWEEYIAQDRPDHFDWGCQGEPDKEDHKTPTIVQTVFPNTERWIVWSGSPVSSYTANAWIVHFGHGYANANYRGFNEHVMLVRERQ